MTGFDGSEGFNRSDIPLARKLLVLRCSVVVRGNTDSLGIDQRRGGEVDLDDLASDEHVEVIGTGYSLRGSEQVTESGSRVPGNPCEHNFLYVRINRL